MSSLPWDLSFLESHQTSQQATPTSPHLGPTPHKSFNLFGSPFSYLQNEEVGLGVGWETGGPEALFWTTDLFV